MRKTKKDAEITKESLITSAFEVLANTSYKAARLEDIARAVGMTRGALYWHFKNKAALYNELVNITFKESMMDLFSFLDSAAPSIDKINGVLNYILGDKIKIHQKSAQIYNLLFIEKPDELNDSLEMVEGWFASLFEKHDRALKEGIEAGEIRDLDTDLQTRCFYNFLWGYFTNSDRFFSTYDKGAIQNYVKENFIDSIAVNQNTN